jgi:CHAD domain-containing protein
MTMPGLRDFVLEAPAEDPGNAQENASDRLPAALAALAQAFTVVSEPGVPGSPGSGVRRHTWLDTFDWRLYRAGLTLEVEQASRGARLLLTGGTGGAPHAEQPVTGWPPRRPALDLPPGPVRDRIAGLISPRALLPVARGVSTVSAMRLLNADGKTVARLIVDRPAVTEGGTTAELAPRLSVAEVRGYPAQARKAASLLAAVDGVKSVAADQHSVFTAALAALGRHPGDYSNGIDAQITGQLPASVAVARLLLRLLDTLELNVDGVLRDIDTEFLHDLRVAVRRTRSALKLLGGVLPAGLAKPYAAEFKWLGDLTTPTRDLDVHLLGFAAMTEQLQAASPADLEPFRAFLARRRVREFRRLAAGLRSARFTTLTSDWRKALLKVRNAGAPRKPRPKREQNPKREQSRKLEHSQKREMTAASLALSTTGRAFGRITAQGGAIKPDSPPESLHDLRKRGKELRYLLEFFAPLHDPVAYKKVVGDLKQLQDGLGDFQDSQVQREEIGALADAMLAETIRAGTVPGNNQAVPAATLLAMGEVAARLAVSQAQARADFARRFARFAGPAAQPRIRALLGEPPESTTPAPSSVKAPAR